MPNPSASVRPLGAAALVSAAVLLGVVAVCTVLATLTRPAGIDLDVMRWSASHRITWLTAVAVDVSDVFAPGPAIVLACLVAAAVAYVRRDVWSAVTVLAPTAVTMIGVVVLKIAVVRPRPPLWAQAVHETDASFPSGHAAGAVALALATVVALWPVLHRAAARAVAVTLAVVLAVTVASARLYVDAHWATDVLAGIALAGAVGFLLPALLERHSDAFEERLHLRAATRTLVDRRASAASLEVSHRG